MNFIEISRFGDPNGPVFDVPAVIEKVREAFPGVRVLAGDPLAMAVERSASMGATDQVVCILRLNPEAYGPACAFEIDLEGGKTIQNRARRYMSLFYFTIPWARIGASVYVVSCKVWWPDKSKSPSTTLRKEPGSGVAASPMS
jgi:hypothetical protein